MSAVHCLKCGRVIKEGVAFCPKCGTPTDSVTSPVGKQLASGRAVPIQSPQTGSDKGVWVRRVAIVALILLVLIVPVFPRDRVVYVDGVTQTVTMSTAFSTSIETFTSPQVVVNVYQGTLQYIPPQYYSVFYDYPNYNYYQYCNLYSYYSCLYYYGYPPRINFGYSYATTVTIQPSDNIVRLQQSPEPNGYGMRLNLTRYDGTSTTYEYVIQQNLSQTGTTIIQGITKTNIITNSIVNPVTSAVSCRQCVLQHVTDHVSLLQLLFGF